MIILGVDFHPEFQQIASVDIDTGEFQEKRLAHREEAEKFYRARRCEWGWKPVDRFPYVGAPHEARSSERVAA